MRLAILDIMRYKCYHINFLIYPTINTLREIRGDPLNIIIRIYHMRTKINAFCFLHWIVIVYAIHIIWNLAKSKQKLNFNMNLFLKPRGWAYNQRIVHVWISFLMNISGTIKLYWIWFWKLFIRIFFFLSFFFIQMKIK